MGRTSGTTGADYKIPKLIIFGIFWLKKMLRGVENADFLAFLDRICMICMIKSASPTFGDYTYNVIH